MGFFHVGNFLNKFKNIQAKHDKGNDVLEAIRKINPNIDFNLSVKNKTIFFYDLSPTAKSELFLIRSEIIKKLKEEFGDFAPDDISFRKP